jgi:N-formylglutamate deformylase
MQPYRLTPPATSAVPLLFDSPHSGRHYPADMQAALSEAELREGEDVLVDELFAAAPKAGATLIAADFPRVYIDANRSMLDIDQALLEAPWPGPVQATRKTELGIGLVWRLTQSGKRIYNRKLSHAELMHRIKTYHQPYQKAVKAAIDHNAQHFGASWHVNCHSMASIGGANSDDVGQTRADFVLGDRDSTTCDREFTMLIYGYLRGLGYSVKINDPYKGVELVHAFSDPAEHRHSLQLEINQRLYLNEATREPNNHFLSLQADLTKLIATLADYTASAADHVVHTCTHHDHGHHDGHDCGHDHGHSHDHGHDHHHASPATAVVHFHKTDKAGHHHESDHKHSHDHPHDHKH